MTMQAKSRDVAESANRVKTALGNMADNAEGLLRDTAAHTGEEIESAREALKQRMLMARQQADGWERSAVDGYRRLSRATDEYVHDNVWKTVAVAAAVSFVAALCMMSSRGRD